jgi:hypothetical protein
VELDVVEMESVVEECEGDNDGDHANGDGFDVEHEAGGDLDVSVGDPA